MTRDWLVERAIAIKRVIEQIFADARHWNECVRQPEEERIDPDPDGKLKLALMNIARYMACEGERQKRTPENGG